MPFYKSVTYMEGLSYFYIYFESMFPCLSRPNVTVRMHRQRQWRTSLFGESNIRKYTTLSMERRDAKRRQKGKLIVLCREDTKS
eukprot:scaffold25842_cov198-Amphora_coffeaeformis.AAC.3